MYLLWHVRMAFARQLIDWCFAIYVLVSFLQERTGFYWLFQLKCNYALLVGKLIDWWVPFCVHNAFLRERIGFYNVYRLYNMYLCLLDRQLRCFISPTIYNREIQVFDGVWNRSAKYSFIFFIYLFNAFQQLPFANDSILCAIFLKGYDYYFYCTPFSSMKSIHFFVLLPHWNIF